MLDPAGPTFMTVATFIDDLDGDGIDQYYGVLDVHHEGSQVWRIDKLRFGLAERRVFFVDVVRLPPSLE